VFTPSDDGSQIKISIVNCAYITPGNYTPTITLNGDELHTFNDNNTDGYNMSVTVDSSLLDSPMYIMAWFSGPNNSIIPIYSTNWDITPTINAFVNNRNTFTNVQITQDDDRSQLIISWNPIRNKSYALLDSSGSLITACFLGDFCTYTPVSGFILPYSSINNALDAIYLVVTTLPPLSPTPDGWFDCDWSTITPVYVLYNPNICPPCNCDDGCFF